MTKEKFLSTYKAMLLNKFDWAHDDAKLTRFMDSVSRTLNGENTWNWESETVQEAWRRIGGKGKVTKKKLQTME